MSRAHEEMIGKSAALAKSLEHLSSLAPINRPVLVIGERGTGKELAAERLHFLSNRWQQPLIKINCAAISNDLLESELFGHEPGAFTGATRTHRGRFERADGGTLFLDELATMSYRLQEKLLRLIEYGEFERLGGQETLYVDVRIVAATNADLLQAAREGTFREDLLDRLSFDVVHLPPLRYRSEDIEPLAQHFAVKMCTELNWEYFSGFSKAALTQLQQHQWPGNIRELKNVVERSIYRWANPDTEVETIVIDAFTSPYQRERGDQNGDKIAVQARADDKPNTSIKPESPSKLSNFYDQIQTVELQLLSSALATHHNHQKRTAQALGLSYHQLRGLLRKHQLIRNRK